MVTACGSSTAPPTAGIHFLSGSNQTDTIQAVLPQSLVIQLVAPTSVAFQTVTFSAIGNEALVEATTTSTPTSSVSMQTDANGKAGVTVILGTKAGHAGVVVSAPSLKYTLTANFTVKPGAATGLQILPSDTAIYVGKSVQLRPTLVDRDSNAVSGGTFQVTDSGPATISGTTATGTAIGGVLVTATSDTLHGYADIWVVPMGRIAASLPDSNILLTNLDGSQPQTLHTPRSVYAMVWNPSGNLLAFTEGPPAGSSTWPILTITPGGTTALVDSTTGIQELVTAFSPDGSLIYYTRGNQLWQVHPDGTGNVSTGFPAGVPSPDGKYILYVDGFFDLTVFNTSTLVATDLTTIVGYQALTGAWSPTGDLIAFISRDHLEEFQGSVRIVNPDGTGLRTPVQYGNYYPFLSWSPDGNYVLVPNGIVGVTSSANLALPYLSQFFAPTSSLVWQP